MISYYKLTAFVFFGFIALVAFWYSLSNVTAKKNSITIGFMGDVMLGRLVNEMVSRAGYSYPWGNLLPELKKNDLNIINLETTLTTSTEKVPKVFNFKADPDKVMVLVTGNIGVANLANNHILDFSYSGMVDTIENLDKAKIKHVGAGNDENEARKAAIITIKGITVGIIGYTDNEPGWVAVGLKPGTNYVKVGDILKVQQDIQKIRPFVDIVIISMHWGPNMRDKPRQDFIDFAHDIIVAGADIFHGHSAHVFQAIELYKDKLIMYDTGDFIDDYAVDKLLRNDHSFLFNVTVDKTGIKKVQIIPTYIHYMQVNLAKNKTKDEILEKMRKLSSDFNTKIDNSGIVSKS